MQEIAFREGELYGAVKLERETEIAQLEQAIAAIEAQRDVLGEAVLRAALAPLREKLAALTARQVGAVQQLKYATVLFTDIVDSTRIGRHLDPEDIMGIMTGALERFREVIEAHSGQVTRFMGDGLKAIFGMPLAREDDAERAVRAGLALLEESRAYAGEVVDRWGLAGFDIRVGINSGQVVLGGGVEAEMSSMGMAINLAARMESAAPVGGLLISHDTYQHVEGLFQVDPQPLIHVKGIQQPLQTYIVLGIRPRPYQDARRGIAGQMTPLCGRQAEMERIISAFEAVQSGSGAQFVSIVGEPGVGKSRLMVEFERWCRSISEELGIMKGRAAEMLTLTPYALLKEVMLDCFDIQGSDTQPVAAAKLFSGLSAHLSGDVEMKTHFIGSLIGLDFPSSAYLRGVQNDPDQLRQRALSYLGEYFEAVLEMRPLIVFLDDVQWADTASLDAFLQIAGGCRQCRLMFVITARPEFYELRPDWDREIQGFELAHRQIRLKRLTPHDSLAMTAEILNSARGELDLLREQVVTKADGNPFYIEELIKMLVEESVLTVGTDGSWQVSSSALESLHIPPTLTAVLQARLDSLPQSQKTALQAAAIIGRVFWDAPLHSLLNAGDMKQADLVQANLVQANLLGLSEREFVLPVEDSTFGGIVEYHFKHQLLHDVAYDTVLKGQRRLYHARAAAWLADNAGANQVSGQFSAVIAHHYQQAGEPLLAAQWYCTAGEYALARGAPGQALDIFHTSIQLLPPDEQELRWRSLIGQVQAASRLGRAQVGLELSDEMLALAHRLGDDYKLADALQNKAYFLGVLGEHQKEMEVIEQTLAAARKSGNLEAESIVIGLKVVSLSNRGDLPAAEMAAEDALAFAQTLDEGELLAKILINVSVFYTTSGDLSQAARLTSRRIEVARRLGDLRGEAYSLENLGYQYLQLGRQEQGIEVLEQVTELAESLGDQRLAIYNQLNLGLAYLRSAEYQQAQAVLENAIASVAGKEELFSHGTGLTYLGLVHEKCGKIGQAASSFEAAVELLEEVEARGYLCDARAGLARCKAVQGEEAAALDHARQVWDFLQESGSSALEFPFLAYLTCAELFTAHDPELAGKAFETGCQELMRCAEKISDPEWRQIYLYGIPEHKTFLDGRKSNQ